MTWGFGWFEFVLGVNAGFVLLGVATLLLNRPRRPGRLELPRERRNNGGHR